MAADNPKTDENSFEESVGEEKETLSQEDYYKIVKPLRTYERDLAESIREKPASKTNIRLKEEERAKERGESAVRKEEGPNSYKKFVFLFLVVILALSAGYFLWIYLPIGPSQTPAESPPASQTETLVRADLVVPLSVEGKDWGAVVGEFKNHPSVSSLSPGRIAVFEPNIRPEEFLREINAAAPSSLLRALGKRMNIGYYSDGLALLPFLIIEVDIFENVFAGMFLWEKTLASDLDFLFSGEETDRTFEDVAMKDKDLRILRNQKEEIVIFYSFLNRKTLLLGNSDQTLREILNR